MNTDENFWDWGNGILYRMCCEWPAHTRADVVAGKMWLIGRAYTASIERGAGTGGESENFYKNVALKITKCDLDSWFKSVSDIRRIDNTNLDRILAVHHDFMNILNHLTKMNRRSFASKYLHFHHPLAFFIFDSRASSKVRNTVGRVRLTVPPPCLRYDTEYAAFVLRCIEYRDADSRRHEMTPRQLDQELLGY